MIAARTIAQTFEGMKAAWVEDRSLFNNTLSQVQRQNPQFLATWTAWEPGALDNKDATFARQAGHDATGRFIPLWHRQDKDVVLEPVPDTRRRRRRLLSGTAAKPQGNDRRAVPHDDRRP